MWVDPGVELETPWEGKSVCVCVCVCTRAHVHIHVPLVAKLCDDCSLFLEIFLEAKTPHLYILYRYIKIRKMT